MIFGIDTVEDEVNQCLTRDVPPQGKNITICLNEEISTSRETIATATRESGSQNGSSMAVQ
jgi:hypothetical protein